METRAEHGASVLIQCKHRSVTRCCRYISDSMLVSKKNKKNKKKPKSQTFLKMVTLVNKDDLFKIVNPQKKLKMQTFFFSFFSELVGTRELMKHTNVF